MQIRVNATRMELLKLKNRLKMARRGHKLLKDKRDELMRLFLEMVKENKTLRERVERDLASFYGDVTMARGAMGGDAFDLALSAPSARLSLETGQRMLMSVAVPRLSFEREGRVHPYGYVSTSGELDTALAVLDDLLPSLLRLAEIEHSVALLAGEIEKTRRRVNALEHVLIPQLGDAVKMITMRLAEMERSNASRLMKIKEIVRSH
ncbi:MAG: V-type ATP synthase subunit D [Bacillota bacterium]|jgi:V/A-type H+-transporting ATPase subunit D